MPTAPGQVGSHQTSKLCPLIHVWPDAGVLGSLTRVSPGTTGRRNLQPSMPPKKKFFLAAWSSGSIMTMPPSCAMASTCSTPAPAAGSAQQRHLLDRCMSFRYKASLFLAAWSSGTIMTMSSCCALTSTCSHPAPQQALLNSRCIDAWHQAAR